jgi:histidine triad (HIT) family protein
MEECIFCKIVSGQIPSEKVYEDSDVIAFLDINPRNIGHTLVLPKKHYHTIMEMSDRDVSNLFLAVKKVANAVKEAVKAYGISINQSNEKAAGQLIPHVHVHVIPRFYTEGPPGLESILPVKKLDKMTMESVAKAIKSTFSAPVIESGTVTKIKKKEEDFFEV